MMLNVIFFARLRELMGIDKLSLTLDSEKLYTVRMVIDIICEQNDEFANYVNHENSLMIAVNQNITDVEATINANDELAFFPPVTGG